MSEDQVWKGFSEGKRIYISIKCDNMVSRKDLLLSMTFFFFFFKVVQKKQTRVLIRLLGQQIHHEMYPKSTKPESSPARLHVHVHM